MKTTFKFIIAAMAVSAVLSSCQKEMAIDNTVSSTDGVRVISASFSAPTKSALDTDGKTPKFVGGETIKVSNTAASEDCIISVDASGNAYFSTTLSGTLTAVYPSTAAKMNEGDVIDETGVLVSTEQKGTFASANIAMATGITTSATFTNKTAVIAITPGAGSNSNYVEVITAGPEIANSKSGAYTKLNKIHVNVNSATTYPVYVSILVPSGLKVKNLSFADGKNIKTAKDKDTAIAVNTINTVGNTGWDTPYVEINGLKWATMNVGAKSKTEAGHYFAWGYAEGCVRNTAGDGWVLASDNTTKKQFNTTYFENRDASSFQDAATSNWGGSWRMPEQSEFNQLINAVYWTWKANTGSYVFIPDATHAAGGKSDSIPEGWVESDALLFFPAAGLGDKENLSKSGKNCSFWSRTINSDTKSYILFITNENKFGVAVGAQAKYSGYSVRPVSD